MRIRHILAAAALTVAAGVVGLPSATQGAGDSIKIIVRFKASVGDVSALAQSQATRYGGAVRGVYQHSLKGYSATVPSSALAALRKLPMVEAVDLDGIVTIQGPQLPWGSWPAFDTPTAQAQDIPTGIRRVNADKNTNLDIDGVDDLRMDVDIAITDTGVDHNHPDLNVVSRVDCTSGTCREGGVDGHGHGSHVSGTAAAIDNGIGVVGIAPGARLHSVKILNDSGSGEWSWIIAGYDYIAARSSTIEVVNSSVGGSGEPSSLQTAVRNLVGKGVVISAAAGNDNKNANQSAPAKYDEVITVSALADSDGKAGGTGGAPSCRADEDDTNANFSNWGSQVDITAPGVCINSTFKDGGYNANYSGTSMAAPHVAGAAALVAMVNKPTNQAEADALRDYLKDAGNLGWTDNSGDGIKEKLLDVGDSGKFPPPNDGNKRPLASFTHTCNDSTLACSFDGSASSDPDGSIVGYAWDFGDGTTATGQTTSHTYAKGGTYSVTLKVTDNQDGTGSTNKNIRIGPNQLPVASFTAQCYGGGGYVHLCVFDGRGSSDPDGTISSWAWEFGDGATGSGDLVTHSYARGGAVTVKLTVTDGEGAKASISKTVTVP